MHYITHSQPQVMAALKENQTFPFQELSHNVYQLKTRNVKFYYSILLMLVNTTVVCYLSLISGERNVMVCWSETANLLLSVT